MSFKVTLDFVVPVSDLGPAPPGVSAPGVWSASPLELELASVSEDSESRPFGSSVAVSASLLSSVLWDFVPVGSVISSASLLPTALMAGLTGGSAPRAS